MLNYIIAVNKNMNVVVLDFETDKKNCKPDIGYETDCEDWVTPDGDYYYHVEEIGKLQDLSY